MSRMWGDIFNINRLVRSGAYFGNSYGKNKRRMVFSGVIFGTYLLDTIGRFAPRMARGIGNGFRKLGGGRRAGRASGTPPAQKGSLQENVMKDDEGEGEESYQDVKPMSKRDLRKMEKAREQGEDPFSESQGNSMLTVKDVREMSKPVEGNALRIQQQVIEACNRYNLRNKTLQVEYELEPPFKKRLWLRLGGKVVKVSEKGLYSAMDNPYYIRGKMSKSDALIRLVSDFSNKQLNLFVPILVIYDRNLYKIVDNKEDEGEEFKEEINEYDDNELNVLGF